MATESRKIFEERGYIIYRNFFPQNIIDDYKIFLEHSLVEDVSKVFLKYGIDLFSNNCGAFVHKLLESENLSPEDRAIFLGHFPLEARLSKSIYPIAKYLGASAYLQDLLQDSDLRMHMPPMMRFVPPGYNHAAVPPHQDISYNRHLSNFLTIWAPMVRIDHECGGLILFEGSNSYRDILPDQDTNGWLRAVPTDFYKSVMPIDLEPGDIIIMSPFFIHKSASNFSNRIRLSIDLRIFPSTINTEKHSLRLNNCDLISPI